MSEKLNSKGKRNRCQVVKGSKRDKKTNDPKLWWKELFQKLEDESKEPDQIRKHQIRQICDAATYDNVCSILFPDMEKKYEFKTIQCTKPAEPKTKDPEPSEMFDSLEVEPSLSTVSSKKSAWGDVEEMSMDESETESEIDSQEGSDLLENMNNFYRTEEDLEFESITKDRKQSRKFTLRDAAFDFDDYKPPEEERLKFPEKLYYRVYRKFYRKPPIKAAIWRPQPPLTYEEMTLSQKAEYVTEKIATEFVDWMKNLNCQYTVSLTPENLMKMFEIGSQNTLAKTLDMKMNEMPALPPKVAISKKMPHLARNPMLSKEIALDRRAAKRKPRIFAFGSRIPADKQVRPQLNDIAAKWHRSGNLREDITSMELVWKGITHLKSTREFCNYMQTNKKDVEPPQYLVSRGLFSRYLYDDDEMSDEDEVISVVDNEP